MDADEGGQGDSVRGEGRNGTVLAWIGKSYIRFVKRRRGAGDGEDTIDLSSEAIFDLISKVFFLSLWERIEVRATSVIVD